jgi:hypothetical protein
MKGKQLFTLLLIGGGIYYFFIYKKNSTPYNPPVDNGFDQYTDYEVINQARLNGLPRKTRDAIA